MNNMPETSSEFSPAIHFGHLGVIALAAVLLLGISFIENPKLFSLKKESAVAAQDVPSYYAYVPPAEDIQPEVLGASTLPEGPSIISDDGTVQPVDVGEVLGATTQGVQLSLDDIKVNAVTDSDQTIKKYFADSAGVETSPVDNIEFETALSSGDQNLINKQAEKFIMVRDALNKLLVPQSLVKLQKLKITQYNSAIAVLQNFTQADNNPQLVGDNLQQFLKSQQDLDNENVLIAQKFGALDPQAAAYVPAVSQ